MDIRSGFNTKRFEQNLSSFGKWVMQNLQKQWTKESNHNSYNRNNRYECDNFYPSYSGKRTFPFNTDSEQPRELTFNEHSSLNFNLQENVSHEIPKSKEMIRMVQANEVVDTSMCINSSVNTKINLYNSCNEIPDVEISTPIDSFDYRTCKSPAMDINWDNMFDTGLFIDAINKINNETVIRKDKQCFDNDTNIINYHKITLVTNKERKGIKRKNEITTSNNVIQKKVLQNNNCKSLKKSSMDQLMNKPIFDFSKNTTRKQNWKKTVKNWLDNIEIHNATRNHKYVDFNDAATVDKANDKVNQLDKQQEAQTDDNNVKNITNMFKIVIDKTKKPKKKEVQSCLANKGGVMKFSKPCQYLTKNKNTKLKGDELGNIMSVETKLSNENTKGLKSKGTKGKNLKTKILNETDTENQMTKEEPLEPKTTKEKKIKKFVAPIRSQIPAKEVLYKIVDVEENNIDTIIGGLQDIIDKDVTVVVTFSNGFCQLNNQYTDDACSPDGILIGHEDTFYYIKKTSKFAMESIKQLFYTNKIICYDGRCILMYLLDLLHVDINYIHMYDTKIGSSLLDPDGPPENFADVQKTLSYIAPYAIATECTLQKAAWYTTLMKECWTKLYNSLVENSLWKVFVDLEMRLLPIIANMERRGVLVDNPKLKSMEELLLNRMKQVEQECYKAAGKVFQINSTVQVRAILYDELKLDEKCNVKIRQTLCKGAKSTSEIMLRSLTAIHCLPRLILEYRHVHKAHATFLAGIAQHVKNGVVKPTWEQTAAATGRIASNNPNLQAIPKVPFNMVMFPDTEDIATEPLNFRSVYIAYPDHSLIAADFKHIECRVFAHAAADTSLMSALASDDLFKVLAAQWLHKPESEILAAERERTKRLVYASLYGAGTRKLMDILDVGYDQALQVSASFNRTFPSLKSFARSVVKRCTEQGRKLSTMCGRGRTLHNIASADFSLRSHAERQAVNFIVQGSAADLCKLAMILTDEKLRSASPAVDAQLLLQIHDELVWHVRDEHVDRAAAIIKRTMEGCGREGGLVGTLPVTLAVGKNWGEMLPYCPTDCDNLPQRTPEN